MRLFWLLLALITAPLSVSPLHASSKPIVIEGSTTVGPIAKSFAVYFTNTYGIKVTVSESGSGNGVKSLMNNTCSIAALSREMKNSEEAAARQKGIKPLSHVIALDALAMIVHPSNPIKTITLEQVAGIYRGTITNWKQLGGRNARIVIVQRESNSGTQEAFKELVTGKKNRITAAAETQSSNGAVKTRVASTPAALGFVGLGFVDSSVKTIAVNKVMPTEGTVKNGLYPLKRPLFFYTNGQPTGFIQKFLALSSSTQGKAIISELGFVAL